MSKVREFGVGFESLSAREFASHAKRAEEQGFSTFWVPEDPFFRGAFTLAATVACSTDKLKIGLGIVNPYTRHPSLTSMEFAALDELSGGRAIMGIGTGIKDWIGGRLKIPYNRPATAIREMVSITRGLFRGEEVTTAGRVFQTDRMKLNFKPIRSEIPIYLGVLGPKNIAMTGEIADGLLLSVMSSPAYVRFACENLRLGLAKSGRAITDFPVSAYILSSISENERAARDALRPFIAILISMVASQPENPIFVTAGLTPETIKAFGESFSHGVVPTDLVTDTMIDTFAIAGSPARCRENLSRLVEAGMNAAVFFEVPGVPPQKTFDDVCTHLMPYFI
jgi:5,10-methylenetetrahydromethanopterin reductase